jgi:5-formyltetrahydrofolate cyclo-ligase
LRRLALDRRAALADADRAGMNHAIARALLDIAIAPAAAIAAYLPIRGEVDLGEAIAAFDGRGHPVGLPVTAGETMSFRRWRPGEALVPLAFGTRGPTPDAAPLRPDVILLPLAAFDARGGRIGYGRGFYDRAIAGLRADGASPRLIGVAFSVQEVGNVPLEPHDALLDLIVTELGTTVPAA